MKSFEQKIKSLRIIEFIGKQSKLFWVITAFVSVLLIGITDYLTGYFIGFSIFYLIPIFLITSSIGKNAGILMSIISTFVWLSADYFARQSFPHPLIPYWNALIRLGFFLIITYMLSVLKDSLEREKQFARIDYLTGIPNLRCFFELANKEMERGRRYGKPVSIAYLDLDNFKKANDFFGHVVGNKLLQSVAATIQNNIRKLDVVARIGGDEFVIMFPETKDKSAENTIRRVIDKLSTAMNENKWPVTFSVGFITFRRLPDTIEEMIKPADDLMYLAKNEGKNIIKYKIFE
ncbi:MAG: GGDEF domain-containing protein [Elusimicrobia bacterium]|nr:GGDEF domain-containing protein [Elusimicrobiota bacterium]